MPKKLKIAFIQQLCGEMMGVMHLSSVLKARGHETILFVEGMERNLVKSVLDYAPDIIGFHTFTGQHIWALNRIRALKQATGALVVVGGPHATYMPDIIKRPGIDAVIRGEADYIMADFCDAVSARDDYYHIPGAWVKKPNGEIIENPRAKYVQNLDELPFPDRELPYRYKTLRTRGNKTFIGKRGCAYPCTFCHNHLAMRYYDDSGNWVRKMSPERLIDEMIYVRDSFPPLRILSLENDDDILNVPQWAEKLFTLYGEKIGLPYYIMTRPDKINENMVRLLKDTGCVGVSISVETANERLRNEVLKKKYSTESFVLAMELLNRYRISTKVFNTVGIPGETLEDAFETLRLNISVKPTWARCSIMQPYPPSDLYVQCLKDGLFVDGFDVDRFDPFYLTSSVLNIPDIDRMVNLQKFFSLVVRFPFLYAPVKRLIEAKPNALFNAVGMMSYGIFGALFERLTLGEFIKFSWSSLSMMRRGE
ncbi:MAG: radical SAM protein [Myxococcales bacterium]|nr:MAG: radical SAM protein [Myxococcales bacterium]